MRVATTSRRVGKLEEISNFTINLMQKLSEKNSQKLNLCDHLLFMYDEVGYSSLGLRKGKFSLHTSWLFLVIKSLEIF